MRNLGMTILAATLATSLAGCETGPSRSQVLASLVGRPESDAIRVLGAPTHVLDANGHRFLAYEDSNVGYVPSAPFGPFGFGYGYYPVAMPIVRSCTMTIEITGGRVASWNLRGACA